MLYISDGSGGSSLKYCEDGLKGIKRAFAAVLRVSPYLAQTHLLSAATTTTMRHDDDDDETPSLPLVDDFADNNTDCSTSLHSISRSVSAIIADPSCSVVASPIPVRGSSESGKFLSPVETPAYTPTTITPASSRGS